MPFDPSTLLSNPAFTTGIGLLSGSHEGNPYGGVLPGLQLASQSRDAAETREQELTARAMRDRLLRDAFAGARSDAAGGGRGPGGAGSTVLPTPGASPLQDLTNQQPVPNLAGSALPPVQQQQAPEIDPTVALGMFLLRGSDPGSQIQGANLLADHFRAQREDGQRQRFLDEVQGADYLSGRDKAIIGALPYKDAVKYFAKAGAGPSAFDAHTVTTVDGKQVLVGEDGTTRVLGDAPYKASAFEKELGKGSAEDYAETLNQGDAAKDLLPKLELLDALSAKATEGLAGPALVAIDQTLSTFGIDPKLTNLAASEQYKSLAQENVLAAQILQKGPQTKDDARRLEESVSTLSQSREGRAAITRRLAETAEYKSKFADALVELAPNGHAEYREAVKQVREELGDGPDLLKALGQDVAGLRSVRGPAPSDPASPEKTGPAARSADDLSIEELSSLSLEDLVRLKEERLNAR